MSDINDVMNVLAAKCSASVYPNGTAQPAVIASTVRVYPGWPTSSSLDQDLQRGNVNVSIFPSGPENNTTRYAPRAHVQCIKAATLTLNAAGQTITVGGAVPSPFSPQNMGVVIGNAPFIYPVQPGDTLSTIAAGLAVVIAVAYPGASSAGPVITVPVGVIVRAARVGTVGHVANEWERQQQRIQVTVWAPDPTSRQIVAAAIKRSLAQINFLTMPDGFGAHIKSAGSVLSDVLEKAKTYRRDLFYMVEYATTVEQDVATVVAFLLNFETPEGGEILQQTF